jgi:hypothetical protein
MVSKLYSLLWLQVEPAVDAATNTASTISLNDPGPGATIAAAPAALLGIAETRAELAAGHRPYGAVVAL